MIYLRTGANGSGKTLLTLRDVREKSLKESRPVYHNGRFEVVPGGPLESWKQAKFEDWETLPDGSIFIVDECHNEMPPRKSGEAVPGYIKALAEHRRRGFDFYFITQHPLNFDAFPRRLIGSPGWHQHFKRASGAPLVSVLQWAAVNEQPQKAGSGASAQVQMLPFPKEVYDWYKSTSLDTAKVRIPFQLKLLIAIVLILPVMGYFAYTKFFSRYEKQASGTVATSPAGVFGPAAAGPTGANKTTDKVQTTAELVASYIPRLPDFPETAPRYDDMTKPDTAPFPAACVSMGARCDCYSQQGTKLQTTKPVCLQIVKVGYFKDWGTTDNEVSKAAPAARPVAVKNDPVI